MLTYDDDISNHLLAAHPKGHAVLSNASPIESSMVLPKITCWPTFVNQKQVTASRILLGKHTGFQTPLVNTAMLCPPETSNLASESS